MRSPYSFILSDDVHVNISDQIILEVCQEGGSRRMVLGGQLRFLNRDMEDMVVPDVMNVFLPQGRYPENFVLISQLKVCPEGRVKKGGTWRTLRVPDQRHG